MINFSVLFKELFHDNNDNNRVLDCTNQKKVEMWRRDDSYNESELLWVCNV